MITFDDLYSIPRAYQPVVSPDAKHIAFVLKEIDAVGETSARHIWIMDADGSNQRQLTDSPGGESHPRWLPDGSLIAFHALQDGVSQVWTVSVEGGEPSPVTTLSTGASGVELFHSGNQILFTSSVYPDCTTDECNRERMEREEEGTLKAKLYDDLMFRHYNAWDDGRTDQLFVQGLAGDTARNVYPCEFSVPSAYLGGHCDYAVAPDGSELCFSISRDSMPAVCINNDLLVVSPRGGEVRELTGFEGLEHTPRYSPDGKYLSYLRKARACYESDQDDLVLYDRAGGSHRNLTESFDRSVGEYVWGAEGSIYFTAIDAGFSKVYRVDIASATVECLLDDAVYNYLAVAPDGSYLVLSRSLSNAPHELHRYDIESRQLIRLTFFTDEIVSRLDLSLAEHFWFEGYGGDSVHGMVTLPPGFDSSKSYPLALLIHGGPQWCWLADFNYYGWNTQLVAAQGYVVVQVDPHGSTGYGIRFKEYVSGNWGKGDFEDLMIGVDYVLSKYSFVDGGRMAALGRSYGGFMANWINGHTDRFDCLVSIDGSFNQVAGYGSTEELWFPEWEFKGTPWTNPEEYHRASPATYAENFTTPTLVIHGQKDYRVDISEGIQMFTTLQRRGVPSQFLYYPDEGHNCKGIGNLRFGYEAQFEWLKRWLE